MILGDRTGIKKLCVKKIFPKLSSPLAHYLSATKWIIASPFDFRLTITCIDKPKIATVQTIRAPLHSLSIKHGCQVFSEYFSLLPQYTGHTDVSLHQSFEIIPSIKHLTNITNIWNLKEALHENHAGFDLSDLLLHDQDTQQIPKLKSAIDKLKAKLEPEDTKAQRKFISVWVFVIFGLIGILMVIVFFIVWYFRRNMSQIQLLTVKRKVVDVPNNMKESCCSLVSCCHVAKPEEPTTSTAEVMTDTGADPEVITTVAHVENSGTRSRAEDLSCVQA